MLSVVNPKMAAWGAEASSRPSATMRLTVGLETPRTAAASLTLWDSASDRFLPVFFTVFLADICRFFALRGPEAVGLAIFRDFCRFFRVCVLCPSFN